MPAPPAMSTENLVPRDGELYYCPDFEAPAEAAVAFRTLAEELDWQAECIFIAGRRVAVPRLVCWYGDAGAVYRYSGVAHEPKTWTGFLLQLRRKVEEVCGQAFNSVLGNFYRDGQDSMGWHADQESSLGRDPVIASLSFGSERLFKLRHNRSKETLDLRLGDGSLLVMCGSLQHHWRHCLPKTRMPCAARINLTFRTILYPEACHG